MSELQQLINDFLIENNLHTQFDTTEDLAKELAGLIYKHLHPEKCDHIWGIKYDNINAPAHPYCTMCGTTENSPSIHK